MRQLTPSEIRSLIEDALQRVPTGTMAQLARGETENRQAALDEITARVQAALEHCTVLVPIASGAVSERCSPPPEARSTRGRLSMWLGG